MLLCYYVFESWKLCHDTLSKTRSEFGPRILLIKQQLIVFLLVHHAPRTPPPMLSEVCTVQVSLYVSTCAETSPKPENINYFSSQHILPIVINFYDVLSGKYCIILVFKLNFKCINLFFSISYALTFKPLLSYKYLKNYQLLQIYAFSSF